MSQHCDAPAYQEYTAIILAQPRFRTMTLQDRGLPSTMRLECRVNARLPQNRNNLANVLRLPIAEFAGSLAAVMPFFEIVSGFIANPEMENDRGHLADRKSKQCHGGKLGSAITNRKHNHPAKDVNDGVTSMSSSTLRLCRRGSGESLVQPSTEKPSQNQSSENEVAQNPWLVGYEADEDCTTDAYAKAGRGI